MVVTKIYNKDNIYECSVVQSPYGYEIVFPPDVTLRSIQKVTQAEVDEWLNQYYGNQGWHK